ncbi:MAG: ABC transporter ATP-binding protein [Deltaproteobacteria bacterium]|nr:ABC transporter ATP-binding protein [Deltaproteobacteria bacterium]
MTRSLLQASGLRFSYGDAPVLRDIELRGHAGEFVGLLGPNGSGKTTLLELLMGLRKPDAGTVSIEGTPLDSLRRKSLARKVSLVPQEVGLSFALTVRETVAMGRNPHLGRFEPERQQDLDAIAYALDVTSTEALADRTVDALSGGERQRVMIARAIAQETPLLLLDEPTANLDVSHQLEILHLVRETVGGGACAIAAIHDLSLASRYCDRLLLLSEGELVAEGVPSEVITVENLARYFGIDAHIGPAPAGAGLSVIPLSSIP